MFVRMLLVACLVSVGAQAAERFDMADLPDLDWSSPRYTSIRAQRLTAETPDTQNYQSVNVDLLHQGQRWRSDLVYEESGREFRADDVFIPQAGIRKLAAALQYRFLELPVLSEFVPYVGADMREDQLGRPLSEATRFGFQARLPHNSTLVAELRPQQGARLREDAPLRSAQQAMFALTSSPFAGIASVGLVATLGETLDAITDRVASGDSLSASVMFRPLPAWEIEPRIDLASLRSDLDTTLPLQDASERAAQISTTVRFSPRNRLRLILQRRAAQREDRASQVRVVDQTSFRGSLLFTHEPSLLNRIYAGLSYSQTDSQEFTAQRDELEIFVKLQAGVL